MTPTDYALQLCARIAQHTDAPGTITRTFLSPATARAHQLLSAEMLALGMSTRTDAAGNLRGLYPAASANAPILLIGSHIDTVPNSGAYDGVLGIALALALVRALNGRKLPYAIEIIAFSEEEGVRFKLPFIGSRALVGTLTPTDLARTDAHNITIAQAIRNYGIVEESTSEPLLTPNTFAFLEPHIEQGPVLESLAQPLGIVTTIIGQSRYGLTFHGEANHAGTTPMSFRKDALAAAAEFITQVRATALTDPALLATVGCIHASPNAANVIPGQVTVSLDVRHPSDVARHAAVQTLLAHASSIATTHGLTLTTQDRGGQPSVPMHPQLQAALTAAAQAAGHTPPAIPSGAGHDAMILAPHLPTAMLFLRTPNGLSHHPNESVQPHDVTAAIQTLQHFLNALNPTNIV